MMTVLKDQKKSTHNLINLVFFPKEKRTSKCIYVLYMYAQNSYVTFLWSLVSDASLNRSTLLLRKMTKVRHKVDKKQQNTTELLDDDPQSLFGRTLQLLQHKLDKIKLRSGQCAVMATQAHNLELLTLLSNLRVTSTLQHSYIYIHFYTFSKTFKCYTKHYYVEQIKRNCNLRH